MLIKIGIANIVIWGISVLLFAKRIVVKER